MSTMPDFKEAGWIAVIAVIAVLGATMISKWYLRSITSGKAGGPSATV